ncbi:hypothetical protein GLOIN_2v1788063 [Rhizophagus clarus]|uniref:BTB domain-containing protein n=1 Tax=Rhizophagus clarus TaxID=94130 RepID=A0A8H3QJJ3_9GLOM|nr:hypothetical protein GLOIN_2v1788063 [Rhizophagus clarus]
MALTFHSGLSKDLSVILSDSDDFNVIIQVGENENIKEFKAHSVILRARSPYFRSAFSNEWISKKNNMIMFYKPNISPIVFEMILKYIYTGELNLINKPGEDILGLLVASDELLLEELFNYAQNCLSYLIKEKPSWFQQNFVHVLNTISKLANCEKLQEYCIESIYIDLQSFITLKDFSKLDRDILYCLLKRDDLQVEETVIWDYLIKWGIEQAGLDSNRAKWDHEDYVVGSFNKGGTLSTDVPYLSLRKIKIKSKIIKPGLANIINNWINKKSAKFVRIIKDDPLYNLQKFDLIYRGSRDGINNKSFKEKCKGQVPSLVLIKVKNSEKIFGGFSSIGFNSISNDLLNFSYNDNFLFYYSSDNFIFSFENSEDTINMKMSRVINYSKAILDYDHSGFNFGRGSLFMKDQKLYVNNCYENYENSLEIYDWFYIEEIETFIVT